MRHPLRGTATTALLAAAMSTLPAAAGAAGTDVLKTAEKAPYGRYLVDGQGRSLYLFKNDKRQPDAVRPSQCYDACADAWPPVTGQEVPKAKGAIDASKLATVERAHSDTRQIAYHGWPLYYYVKDKAPGDVKGQDVHGFGAGWYLVAPDGTPIEKE